jgi:hypothetical protein
MHHPAVHATIHANLTLFDTPPPPKKQNTHLQSAIHSRPSSRLAQVLAGVSSGGLTGALRTALRSSINAGGRDASANGSPQQHVDAAAWALLDVAKTCTYRVTNTYGGVLASLVAARKPLVGTTADAQALLAGFLACEQ